MPGLDELKASGLLDTRPAGTIIGDTGEMYEDAVAEGAPEEEEPEALSDGDDVTAEPAYAGIGEPFAEEKNNNNPPDPLSFKIATFRDGFPSP